MPKSATAMGGVCLDMLLFAAGSFAVNREDGQQGRK